MDSKTLKSLQKKYGVFIGHLDTSEAIQVASIPTGLIALDHALGIGGIPKGKITEIFAPEGAGKTTLSLQIIASAQKQDIAAAYVDMENRLDVRWAETLGVNLGKMYFTQPSFGEDAMNITKALIEGGVGLVVIDSVPSLTPKKEYEGETGDQFVGLLPRLLSQALRQMAHPMSEHGTAVIFINQMRAKIGMTGFGGATTTQPGGWALRHNASVRLSLRYIQRITDTKNQPIGQKVRATVVKSSVSTPMRVADLSLMYGIGFDNLESVIDSALDFGFIEQGGAWYTIGEEKIQGRSSLKEYLESNTAVVSDMEEKIRSMLFGTEDEDSGEEA